MSSVRLLSAVMVAGFAGVTTYGLFTRQRAQNHPVVKMKPTRDYDPASSPLLNYDYLKSKLLSDKHHSAIFICALHKQHASLTREQVIELATLAIKHHHAIHLDNIAGFFPEIITPQWLNQALIENENRFMFSSLLRKHAAGKIHHLQYLFDPASDVVLIEQSDHQGIAKAGLFNHPRKIVLIDTEPYNPDYKYLQ